MNDKELFRKFTKQLSIWSRTGEEPELGDYNVRAYLDAQEKRLEKKGVTRSFEFKIKSEIYKVGNFMLGVLFNGYNKRVNYAIGQKKIEYFKGKKSIYKDKIEACLYQLIKWPQEENEDWKKETYVCPNCGHIEQIAKLEESGCEYCGTKFLVSELYPKVTNFYVLENIAPPKRSLSQIGGLLAGSLVFALILTVSTLSAGMSLAQEYSLPYLFLIMYVSSFVIGLIIAPVIFQIADSIPVSIGVAGAKGKITSKLKKYDETFSYDYFEGKALSLLRMIVFAENPSEYIQYEGKALHPDLENIVDMEYRGGINVEKIAKIGEYLHITLKVYMINTYFTGKKCRRKKDTMYLDMKHNTSFRVLPDFSIVKVMCRGCGGSFDATKHCNCPYCGKEYDAGVDDWMITGIRIGKKK